MSIFVRLDDQAHPQMRLMIKPAACRAAMVGRGGLEPPTSRLSGVRSNHLSYRPVLCAAASRRGGLVEPIGIEPMTS